MARKFFYVCSGMLMLALAYHFGASNVAAQAGGIVGVGEIDLINGTTYALVSGTTVYGLDVLDESRIFHAQAPMPESWQPAAVHYFGFDNFRVLLTNGDCYEWQGASWALQGNIFGGSPVPALHESWGQLKSRYRTTAPQTPGMTARPGADNR